MGNYNYLAKGNLCEANKHNYWDMLGKWKLMDTIATKWLHAEITHSQIPTRTHTHTHTHTQSNSACELCADCVRMRN